MLMMVCVPTLSESEVVEPEFEFMEVEVMLLVIELVEFKGLRHFVLLLVDGLDLLLTTGPAVFGLS